MVRYILYKKSIIIIIGFLFFSSISVAQLVADARLYLAQKDYPRAKDAIDSYLQINPDDASTLLLKASIYNQLGKDADARYLVADARYDAFQALQRAVLLNKILVEDSFNRNYGLPLDLYNGFTNDGINYFNAGMERNDKTVFNQAVNLFKKAGQISHFIYSNGWGLTLVDTINLYFTAKAAINAGNEAVALEYSKKIADAGIVSTQNKYGFESIYQWLVYNYKQKKEADNFKKYTEIALLKFPESVYFNLINIDWLRMQRNYSEMFNSYKQVINNHPGNFRLQLAYYNDIFNYLYKSKEQVTDRFRFENELEKGLNQFLKKVISSTEARLLLAKNYINQANLNRNAITRKSLLIKSNAVLNELTQKYCSINSEHCKEGKALLKSNLKLLQVRTNTVKGEH